MKFNILGDKICFFFKCLSYLIYKGGERFFSYKIKVRDKFYNIRRISYFLVVFNWIFLKITYCSFIKFLILGVRLLFM